jgi:hypothetical protein
MAKHRRMSDRSRRTRTVVGGVTAGGLLAIVAPAALAHAEAKANEVPADTPGHAVGRPDLKNPAPGLRTAQQFGDSIFNDSTPVNKALNTSPVGTGYHQVFGTQGDLRYDEKDGIYYYDTTTGENGAFTGVLNTTPGNIVGDAIPLRECNLESDPGSLAPKFSVRAQCSKK